MAEKRNMKKMIKDSLFTIAKYRGCSATAMYIITDVISEDGWHLGWEGNKIDEIISKIVDVISV